MQFSEKVEFGEALIKSFLWRFYSIFSILIVSLFHIIPLNRFSQIIVVFGCWFVILFRYLFIEPSSYILIKTVANLFFDHLFVLLLEGEIEIHGLAIFIVIFSLVVGAYLGKLLIVHPSG